MSVYVLCYFTAHKHSDGDYRDHIAGDPVEFIAIREAVYGACSAPHVKR